MIKYTKKLLGVKIKPKTHVFKSKPYSQKNVQENDY